MDIVDYILLPLIFLFRTAFTFKTLFVPFLVQYFRHNLFLVIGWEDYVIWWSLMMTILFLYQITINILKSFQLYTFHYHSSHVFCGTSLAHHQKGRVSSIYSSTLMHQQDLCKKMISGQYTPSEGWCVITMTINFHQSYKCVVTANTKLNQWIRALLQPLMLLHPLNL